MRPDAPRRPLASLTAGVPPFQVERGFTELRDRLGGIEQISIIPFRPPEVLPPQLQPQVTCELASSVAEAGRIDGGARVACGVDDRAGDLGVVAPRPSIEVVRSDGGPHVVDHADLGVDVNRNAVKVLDVVDRDAVARRIEKDSHRMLAAHLVRSQRKSSRLVEKSRDDRDEMQ